MSALREAVHPRRDALDTRSKVTMTLSHEQRPQQLRTQEQHHRHRHLQHYIPHHLVLGGTRRSRNIILSSVPRHNLYMLQYISWFSPRTQILQCTHDQSFES